MNNIFMDINSYPRTEAPDQELINLIESMGRCVRETEGHFPQKRWYRLGEIYYYLRYGMYGNAWKAINNLRDDLRWRIPSDVYHTLKDICKDMDVKIA